MTVAGDAQVVAQARLLSTLSERQRQRYTSQGVIEVRSQRGWPYLIGPSWNVRRADRDLSFCIHPRDYMDIPVADGQLAIALMLRTDEDQFLRIAVPFIFFA